MKKRIFLGLIPILIVFVAIGIYAVWLFAELGGRIDVILRENYQSVLAGQQMKEALERMDSGLSFALAAEQERGKKMFDENVPLFKKGLDLELNNITLPGEGEIARKIRDDEEKYLTLAADFWQTPDLAAKRSKYFPDLLPLFTQIKNNAQAVIQMNQENMVQSDHNAQELSRSSTRTMIVLLAVGIAAAIIFGFGLLRAILNPIRTLTSVSRELGEGNLDQIVPVSSKDELGELADAFNKLAGRLRAYRQITTDQILQARQMTEITFSAFPDPIVALSLDGKVTFSNPAAEKLLQSLDAEYGLPVAVQEEVSEVLKGGPDFLPTTFDRAVPVRIGDQEAFLLARIIGMKDEQGHLFGAAVVLQDVTRFRLLDEVKTNLVSTVSHELKTPLTSVRMGLYLLLEEKIGSLNPKQTELLLAARDDADRLLRMINDLLDLARLESGQVGQRFETISPKALIENIVSDLQPLVEASDSRLETQVEKNIPNVSVDVRRIGHVFSNFVSNAARHSKPGEPVVLSVKGHGGSVRFSVLDQGPGIPIEYQSRIFDRFFRIPGGNGKTGIGLGLAIAREIVVAHGGAVGVQSVPGKGSEFYFDLPGLFTGEKS
jgi:NtrC-family two-component system sensor histidine kinase KinB